jgi:hypothetical protein
MGWDFGSAQRSPDDVVQHTVALLFSAASSTHQSMEPSCIDIVITLMAQMWFEESSA